MKHPIHRVTSAAQVGPYALSVDFDDDTTQTIDFEPILEGELYGPLREPAAFARFKIDPEVHTIVWDSGADFDPATLHGWPEHRAAFVTAAKKWRDANVAV